MEQFTKHVKRYFCGQDTVPPSTLKPAQAITCMAANVVL